MGKELSQLNLEMLTDNTGENISSKNRHYCELSAMYWAWKNLKNLDYIGFFHYRRYLNFNSDDSDLLRLRSLKEISNDFVTKYGLNDDLKIYELIEKHDLILPRPSLMYKCTNERVFKEIDPDTSPAYWDTMIDVLLEKYPEYKLSLDNFSNSMSMHSYSIFITSFEIFSDYMEWLFDIFFEVERRLKANNFHLDRGLGFLGERMTDIYFAKLSEEHNLKIKELQPLLLEVMSYHCVYKDESNNKIEKFIEKYKNKRICFYGAGSYAKNLLENFDLSKLNILGFIDLDTTKRLDKIGNHTIYSIQDIDALNPEILAVSVKAYDTVLTELENLKAQNDYKFEICNDLAGNNLL